MSFGEFFKQKRLETGLTLRKFCEINEYDPGNISKIERGILPPPHAEDKLKQYATALHIKIGSNDWSALLDTAQATNKSFTVTQISDEAVLGKLPTFFRTLDNKDLTAEKLDKIIDLLKS